MISERTPAKLILSGEHAVVYGNAALAVAIKHRNLSCKAKLRNDSLFSIESTGLNYHRTIDFTELNKLAAQIDDRYNAYLRGKLAISEVARNHDDLLLYTLQQTLNYLDITQGIDLHIESSIPIGCGMGSSAAVIINLLKSCHKLTGIKLSEGKVFQLAKNIENRQHGQSSGLDLQVIYHESAIFLENDTYKKISLPEGRYYGVNTGTPDAATGECVVAVKEKMTPEMLLQFQETTQAITAGFEASNTQELIPAIQKNHRLLTDIGVVPTKIQAFIERIEKSGGAAKICGAGSIRGDNAGFLLLVGEETKLRNVCIEFNYQLERLSW